MLNALLVMGGGALGALLRYGLSRAVGPVSGWPMTGWPWATLMANVLGGLLMGLLAGWLAGRAAGAVDSEKLRLLLGVGLLGGFTTFSAFSIETVRLMEAREYVSAGLYVAASVILSVAAVMVGLWLMRKGVA
jgi:CrcB protein